MKQFQTDLEVLPKLDKKSPLFFKSIILLWFMLKSKIFTNGHLRIGKMMLLQ